MPYVGSSFFAAEAGEGESLELRLSNDDEDARRPRRLLPHMVPAEVAGGLLSVGEVGTGKSSIVMPLGKLMGIGAETVASDSCSLTFDS